MNQQTYRKITDGIRGLENGEKIVQFINSIATKIVYMAYVVGIIILFEKNKKGESMPSRHVFSAFIIGMAFFYIGEIPLGIIVFVCGLIIAIVRVISGVHFPKDVIVGALVGILCGVVGFFTF